MMLRRTVIAWMAAAVLLCPGIASAVTVFEQPASVEVLNPDLDGLTPVPGGGVLAWGSDGSIWRQELASKGSGSSGWKSAHTGHDGRVRGIASAHWGAGSPIVLVAFGDGGLLKTSADGGVSWRTARIVGLEAPSSKSDKALQEAERESMNLAAAACGPARCLAVGPGNLLLESRDGGAVWHHDASPQRPEGPLTTVVMAPDGSAWVGSADGRLWQWVLSKNTWQERRLQQKTDAAGAPGIFALALDGDQVLVATTNGWLVGVPVGPGYGRIEHRHARGSSTRFRALPGKGAWAAVGNESACAWRPASGQPWRNCDPARSSVLGGLASSPDGKDWVLVGEGGLLMQGRPPQRPWRAIAHPVLKDRPKLEDVTWSDALGGFVAVGPGGLILHSSADGQRWEVAHSVSSHYVHAVVAPKGGTSLLASMSYRTLARSDDGGRNWISHRFDALQDPAFLYAMHADIERGSVVVAGGQGSLMVAPDGQTWRQHTNASHDYLGLLAHPKEPLALLYGTGGRLMRVQTQAGAWQAASLPSKEPMYGGFYGPDARPILVGGDGGDSPVGVVTRGSSQGQKWVSQRLGRSVLRVGGVTPDGSALLVAGDGGALFRAALSAASRADASASPEPGPQPEWKPVSTPDANWYWLQTDAAGQSVWLGGSGGNMVRSADGGLNWQRVELPTDVVLRRPVWDEKRRTWWMTGREGTLLRSSDDGLSWQRVFTHTREHFKGVWINPQSGDLLLYGARLVLLTPKGAL